MRHASRHTFSFIGRAAGRVSEHGSGLRLGAKVNLILLMFVMGVTPLAAWGKVEFRRSPEGCGADNQNCTAYYDEGSYKCCEKEPEIKQTVFLCFAGRSNNEKEHFKQYKICMQEDFVLHNGGFDHASFLVYRSLVLFNPGSEPEHLGLSGTGWLKSLPRCRLPYWMPRWGTYDTDEAPVCVSEYAP